MAQCTMGDYNMCKLYPIANTSAIKLTLDHNVNEVEWINWRRSFDENGS